MEYVVVFITTSGQEESQRIARALLEKRLAACANIVPDVFSLFLWKGDVEAAEESLMVVKTKRRLLDELYEEVGRHHSYDVFEAICLPIVHGNKAYLDWMDEALGQRKNRE